MNASTTLGIICGGLILLAVVIAIIAMAVQNSRHKKTDQPTTMEEDAPQAGISAAIEPPSQPAAAPASRPEAILPVAAAVEAPKAPVGNQPLLSKDIVARLKDLPPVQEEIEKKKFLGQKVEWTLYYSSLMLKAEGKVEVSLLNAGNNYPAVSFIADYNQYPELRKPTWGMPVMVKGTIHSVYSMVIVLTDVELSFPQ